MRKPDFRGSGLLNLVKKVLVYGVGKSYTERTKMVLLGSFAMGMSLGLLYLKMCFG